MRYVLAILLLLSPLTTHAALTDNETAYYKLDEASGDASDSAGANTLANNGTATYTTGKINNGITLASASSQYLSSASPSLAVNSSFSISMWVKHSTVGQMSYTQRRDGTVGNENYLLYLNNGNQLLFGFTGAFSAAYTWTPSTGVWYHLVGVFDDAANTETLYINGAQVAQATGVTATPPTSGSSFVTRVGRTAGGDNLNGMVDEVGLWNRALSPAEVTSLYNSGAGLQHPFATAVNSIRGLVRSFWIF